MTDIIERLRGLAQNPYPHGRAGQFGQTFLDRFAQSLTQQAQANQLAQMEERKAAAQAGQGMMEIPSWFSEKVKTERGIDLPTRVDPRIFQMFTPLFADAKQVDPKTLEDSLKIGADFDKASAPYRDIARNITSMNAAWDKYSAKPEQSPALAKAMMAQMEQILRPNSQLRETAIAQSVEGQSLMARLTQGLTQLREGGGQLGRAAMQDLLDVANTLAGSAMLEYDALRANRMDVVGRYNLDEAIVVGPDPFELLRSRATTAAPGTRPNVGGFRIEGVAR